MLVVTLGELNHHFLGVFRKFTNFFGRRSGVPREGRHNRFRRDDGAVLNHATVLQNASPSLEEEKSVLR